MQLRALKSAGIGFASFFLLSSTASASVSDDQVTSQKIREADGTSGQNTNSGSGVKTNHIQNAAVTTTKIADGAVSTQKLVDGAVTASKLGVVCPDGQYLQYTAASGWSCSVGTPGPEGPAGPPGPQGQIGPQGPAGAAPHYANVVVVAKSGGDFAEPIAAMNSITDASAENPYLLKIMPGIYDIGASSLLMKEYVDIEGSGEVVTVIRSTASAAGWPPIGTVTGVSNSEIRFLRVENNGTGELVCGIASNNGGPRLTHVAVDVQVAPASYGYGVINHNSEPSQAMIDVTVTLSGTAQTLMGVWNQNSSSRMQDVKVVVVGSANTIYGVFNQSSSLDLNDTSVTVEASSGAYAIGIYNEVTVTSLTDSSVSVIGGSTSCGVQNASSSAPVRNVTVSTSGASAFSKAISVSSSALSLTDVMATATGPAQGNSAISIQSSAVTLTNITAVASGAVTGNNNGIVGINAALTLSNVTAAGGYGFRIYGASADTLVDRSTLEGSISSIDNDSAYAVRIGASKLIGSVSGGGAFFCAGTYDGAYAMLGNACW